MISWLYHFDADFPEAKKRITVDLAQQQIRREGCEAGDAGAAGALTTDLHDASVGCLEAIPFEVDSFRKFLPQSHFVPIFDALVESIFVFDVTCCRYTNHYTVNNLQMILHNILHLCHTQTSKQ